MKSVIGAKTTPIFYLPDKRLRFRLIPILSRIQSSINKYDGKILILEVVKERLEGFELNMENMNKEIKWQVLRENS